MYAGAVFNVESGDDIIIGSDARQAHVIISGGGGESVSNRHCSVFYDSGSGTYYIVNYSQNGTFKADGTPLPMNSPVQLPAGSIIIIGNSGNSFRLG